MGLFFDAPEGIVASTGGGADHVAMSRGFAQNVSCHSPSGSSGPLRGKLILGVQDRNLCQDSCFLQWVTKIVKSKILHCKKAWSNNDMSLLQCVKETIN